MDGKKINITGSFEWVSSIVRPRQEGVGGGEGRAVLCWLEMYM